MQRLQIPVLPSIVNAALLTSVISAGNAYTFNASRSLHALALEGQAPMFLRRLNKKYVSSTRLSNTYMGGHLLGRQRCSIYGRYCCHATFVPRLSGFGFWQCKSP